MKKLFISLETSGFNELHHGIIRISGIIDIDNMIVDTFDFNCQSFITDAYDEKMLELSGLTEESWDSDPNRLSPSEVYKQLLKKIEKYVSGRNTVEKFQFIGYNSYGYEYPFIKRFFEKNGNSSIHNYFWYPPIDLVFAGSFILEEDRPRIVDFRLPSIAQFFGFIIESNKIMDSFYRVDLVRNLYYIFEKFKAPMVFFKKAKKN